MFQGYDQQTVDFLWGIRFNNDRSWFQEHKEQYQTHLLAPTRALGEQLYDGLHAMLPHEPLILKVSRIYRDARRLHGQGPYKDHLWLCVRTGDQDWTGRPTFYFEIAPDYYSYGMGFWCAAPALMALYRQRIDADPKPLEKLVRRFDRQQTFRLTGPEYAGRYIEMLRSTGVRVELGTMVLEVTPDKKIHCVSKEKGYQILEAKSVILCMGCRERTRGAIGIPGTRPAGIYTAGAAQRYVNMEGYLVGKRVLILGSGDIGLIMARRMTLEGAKVLACVEVMPYSGGLTRNIVQCLQDFDIPLYLSHTIVDIQGDTRVEKAIVAKVDENRRPIPGTEMEFDVDTILLSVGLIPENELTRQAGIPMDPHTKGAVVYENMETGIPGVFACGNVVHVHDLVDFVSGESDRAGAAAAAYVLHGETPDAAVLDLVPGNGVGYTVPQRVRPADVDKGVEISFRVRQNYGPSQITITCGEKQLARFKRQRMAPGEMEHITLPGALLAKADGPLTVAVEEVVAK